MLQVNLHGSRLDLKFQRDLLVGVSMLHEFINLLFPLGQCGPRVVQGSGSQHAVIHPNSPVGNGP
jgi:hypothetical protein